MGTFVHLEGMVIRCRGWWVQQGLAARADVLPWANIIRELPEDHAIEIRAHGWRAGKLASVQQAVEALNAIRTPVGQLSRATFVEVEPIRCTPESAAAAIASDIATIEVLDDVGRAWRHNRQSVTVPNFLHDLVWMIDTDGTLFAYFAGSLVLVLYLIEDDQT